MTTQGFHKDHDPAGDTTVDLKKFSTAKKLVDVCIEFFAEMENLYVSQNSVFLRPR